MSAIFVKLDASYHQDPKLLDLDDERAELLWVRGLTYCKTHLTDGVIHRRALPSFAPFQDDIAPADLAAMLVATGAWREHPKGWIVPSCCPPVPASDPVKAERKRRRWFVYAHLRAIVFERDGHRCRRCGRTDRLEVDHVVPMARGGSDDLDNLQTLCKPCNASKKDRVP